jgi:hypothetical protein
MRLAAALLAALAVAAMPAQAQTGDLVARDAPARLRGPG